MRILADNGTTNPGYINRKVQINLGRTDPERLGSDHGQYIYVMHCPKCRTNYGANGTDIFQSRCPHCQNGAEALPLERMNLSGVQIRQPIVSVHKEFPRGTGKLWG